MIAALEIQNFKCFEHLRLAFGSLTLFTGFNGGGKSTAIQPLLLLGQGLRASKTPQFFALNGPLVRLGTVGDVLPSDKGRSIVVTFSVYVTTGEATWVLSTRSGDRLLLDARAHTEGMRSDVDQDLAQLAYLSAVREGTADAYPIPDANHDIFGHVGTDGRFAPYLYDQFVDNEVPERRRHPDEPATSVRKQLDAWLGTLFSGAQANVQLIPQVSLLCLQFRLSEIGSWRRPANIGYGLSYAFPFLVALLTAQEGQIIVIDSPEAHLHPFAQSQMGRLLAHFAAAGVQILVETHSDHLLNGVRIAVKNRTLAHADVRIHFFTGATSDGHGVLSPSIDADGRIDEWPNGFFDQSEKDLSRLTGWA
jgi:CRISPR-associated Cas5-like protein